MPAFNKAESAIRAQIADYDHRHEDGLPAWIRYYPEYSPRLMYDSKEMYETPRRARRRNEIFASCARRSLGFSLTRSVNERIRRSALQHLILMTTRARWCRIRKIIPGADRRLYSRQLHLCLDAEGHEGFADHLDTATIRIGATAHEGRRADRALQGSCIPQDQQ